MNHLRHKLVCQLAQRIEIMFKNKQPVRRVIQIDQWPGDDRYPAQGERFHPVIQNVRAKLLLLRL